MIQAIRDNAYWLMLGLGTVAMVIYVWLQRKKHGLSGCQSIVFTLLCAAGGFMAGKLLTALLNWEQVSQNGFFSGGQSIFGPIFLDILIVPLIGRIFKISRRNAHDLCGPCLALLIGCQRIGCYFAGCCAGWLVTLSGFTFRLPAQMIESLGDFLILGVLLDKEKSGQYEGRLYPLFLMYYGALRFFVEFLRVTEKSILFLSHFQWLSLLAILIGYLWNEYEKGRYHEKN